MTYYQMKLTSYFTVTNEIIFDKEPDHKVYVKS